MQHHTYILVATPAQVAKHHLCAPPGSKLVPTICDACKAECVVSERVKDFAGLPKRCIDCSVKEEEDYAARGYHVIPEVIEVSSGAGGRALDRTREERRERN